MEPDKAILCVIDMQNDFTKGSFAIENNKPGLDNLVTKILPMEWKHVFATKDFHPRGHMSFLQNAGPFPAHCVQDTFLQGEFTKYDGDFSHENILKTDQIPTRGGARFDERVLAALPKEKTTVFFKAFNNHVDSFGASTYSDADYLKTRTDIGFIRKDESTCDDRCINAFTGSYAFPLENLSDIDSDPAGVDGQFNIENSTDGDTMSRYEHVRFDTMIENLITDEGINAVYVCGLALDFCVQDTAINLKKKFPDLHVSVIVDASTPANPSFDAEKTFAPYGVELVYKSNERPILKSTKKHPFVKGFEEHVQRIRNATIGGGDKAAHWAAIGMLGVVTLVASFFA